MVTDQILTFNKFYIVEFLGEVLKQVPQRLSGPHVDSVKELIGHLNRLEDVTDGIEVIAREHGSGELSIFLFDIVDRMEDYPPSVAYDALMDIVDDFVSGLDLMLEEEETVAAIINVNKHFSEKIGEVETEAPVADNEPEATKPEPVPEETPEPSAEEDQKEPQLNFEQFIETDMQEKISAALKNQFARDFDKVMAYHNLIINNLDSKDDLTDAPLIFQIMNALGVLFPWKCARDYNINDITSQQADNIRQYIENLTRLMKDEPKLVADSLKENRVLIAKTEPDLVPETESQVKPEPEPQSKAKPVPAKKTEYIREEVSEEPMTIDALLSEYFQSEVDEHIESLTQLVSDLSEQPGSVSIMKDMIAAYQSFNEISMIHGYVLIESYCNRMIEMFAWAVKEKMEADTDRLSVFADMNSLLSKTSTLKDQKKETKEAQTLDQLTSDLESDLFQKKSQKAKKPAGKTKKDKPAAEKKGEEQNLSELKDLTGIMADIFSPAKSAVANALLGRSQDGKILRLIEQLASSAKLIGLKNLADAFLTLNAAMSAGGCENEAEINKTVDQFATDISPEIDAGLWQKKINVLKKTETFISADNTEKLLMIIAEIEAIRLKKFPNEMEEIYKHHNRSTQFRSQAEFVRLQKNLSMINRKDLSVFAEYLAGLFAADPLIQTDKAQQDELQQSFKLFIESLKSGGKGVDPADLVSILKEMFQSEPVAEQAPAPVVEESEPVTSSDEGEEDLAEIFRQEAATAIDKIKEALTNLQNDMLDRTQYRTIERNVHSLKSSARLLGNDSVAGLAGPVEDVCEKLASEAFIPDQEKLVMINEAVSMLERVVEDSSTDTSAMIENLRNISFDKTDEVPGSSLAEKASGDKPLFSEDSDEDDDLLEIFKEESADFIKLLEEARDTLSRDPVNEEAIKKLEHASHSLKSPAKMLGFREIGELGDALENIAEAAKKRDLVLNKASVAQISGGIAAIKELSGGKKPESETLSGIFDSLNIEKLKLLSADDAKDASDEEAEPVSASDLRVFLQEATDLLEKINQDMLSLEKTPHDNLLIASISRYLHTLKGSAQIMGYEKIGSLTHAIEDVFAFIKDEKIAIPESSFDVIFKALDGVQKLTGLLGEGKNDPDNIHPGIMKMLSDELNMLKEKPVTVNKPLIRPVQIEKANETQKDTEQTIKITTERLDKFVNMAAELVINKTQLADQLEKLREIGNGISLDRDKLKKTGKVFEMAWGKPSGDNSDSDLTKTSSNFDEILSNLDELSLKVTQITQKVDQNINQISHLSKSLHDDILQVRMVQTTLLFSRFPRAVRDMAKKQKKKINLLYEGEDTEMDRAMIESLTDPVMHLIRNAIDHGIELPKARKGAGKNDDGIILLKARRDKNQVIIEVQDDGKGIAIAEIKKAIVNKKLAEENEIKKMTNEEILDYIFHPGFTTKKSASSTSGRGVGLDVVAATIQNLKGDIRVNSTPGKGTIFSIRLPLTLAITQALIVEVCKETVAIPLNSVEETQDLDTKKIIVKNDKKYLKIRSREIPLIKISDFMHFESDAGPTDSGNVLVIQDGSIRYGLVVDRAIRREEIVVRSLGDELKDLDFVAGGTIFGDGSVVLILDIPAFTRHIEDEYFDGHQDFSSLETARRIIKGDTDEPAKPGKIAPAKTGPVKMTRKKIESRKPTALIIDDSLSVRKFVSSVLERNNYATTLAEDGPEALEELKGSEFDIIITDLEMPKMQGFELIEKIREQDRLKEVPIVILTGKAAKENEAKGIQLGANAYIVKPFKENDLLKTLEQFIVS